VRRILEGKFPEHALRTGPRQLRHGLVAEEASERIAGSLFLRRHGLDRDEHLVGRGGGHSLAEHGDGRVVRLRLRYAGGGPGQRPVAQGLEGEIVEPYRPRMTAAEEGVKSDLLDGILGVEDGFDVLPVVRAGVELNRMPVVHLPGADVVDVLHVAPQGVVMVFSAGGVLRLAPAGDDDGDGGGLVQHDDLGDDALVVFFLVVEPDARPAGVFYIIVNRAIAGPLRLARFEAAVLTEVRSGRVVARGHLEQTQQTKQPQRRHASVHHVGLLRWVCDSRFALRPATV